MGSMKRLQFTMLLVIFQAFAIFSNPVAPTQLVRLSEVQITDSTHWTIEVFYGTPFSGIDTTYFLFGRGFNLNYHPSVQYTNGYGLITPSMYPNLRLRPGDTVFLLATNEYIDTANPYEEAWSCVIDKTLKPTQSMAAFQRYEQYYCMGPSGPEVQWCKDAHPTLGLPNDSTAIYGVIKGFVCDKDSQPVQHCVVSYRVPCNICDLSTIPCSTFVTTDSSGYFYLQRLVSTDQRSVAFPGISSLTFGPFYPEPECTTSVVCKLSDYIPSSAHNPLLRSSTSLRIVGVTKSKSDVLIVFNGSQGAGDYNVAVYSLNGKKMYCTTVSNSGSGTYSVAWNSRIHSGTYVVKIRSQSASVEKDFTIK